MPGADINNVIDFSANEFLSATDLAIKKEQEHWEKLMAKKRLAIEIEYSLRGQMERELLGIVQQIKLKQNEVDNAKDLKSKKKALQLLDKLKTKLKEKERKKEQKEELKIANEIEKSKAAARKKSLLLEAEEQGYSWGNAFALVMATEAERVANLGGFGKAFKSDLAGAGKLAAGAAQKALTLGVDDAMELFVGKASRINARLQGTSKTFNQMNDIFEKNLGASPFIRYADAVEELANMVDAGIAYNVELRAFLSSISDKIATTFDAANGTLLKIIRILQEDSTVYRLGAEAELTKFFNKNFQDTTYMTDVYDSVSQAVADSVALLSTAGGAEYEYNLLKWLGSLYSLGMSSDTLISLASALNMLSTGDVEGLAGSGLLNLLVMAANKGNIAYADLLTLGVNANNVNTLMSNIVSYWSELATTLNQVVRKQYADLFGLDMSDMVAIKNVNQDDMKNILGEQFAYSSANAVLQEQFNQIAGRMHISELIQNTYKNMLTGIGTTLASSPGLAVTWLVNNLIKDATGGINVPHITAMGTGIGLEADLNSIVNLGMVGIGTLGLIGNVISSISNKGGLNLSAWGADLYTSHGLGTAGIVTGVLSTTSQQSFVGNTNSSDIHDSSLHAAYDNVDTTVAGEATDDADLMLKAITESIDPNVKAILDLLNAVTTGSAIRVKVEDYGLTSF